MKITVHTPSGNICELKVGTTHHPYAGPMPEIGQTIIIPDEATVDREAVGRAKVKAILWHFNASSNALWPVIVCTLT